MKRRIHLESLNCTNCASLLAKNLQKLDYIKEVSINYDTKDLLIIGNRNMSDTEVDLVIKTVTALSHCAKHDHGEKVTEEFKFANIDCPNCAMKVEEALNKNTDIINARVSFLNKKILITHLNNVEVFDTVSSIVAKVEDNAVVIKSDTQNGVSNHDDSSYDHIDEVDNHTCEHDHCCEHNHNNDHKSLEQFAHDRSCNCQKCHDKKEVRKKKKLKVWSIAKIILAICMFLAALIFKHLIKAPVDYEIISRIFYVACYILISYELYISAFKRIIRGQIFDENLLMIIASLGAIIVHEEFEAIIVIVLFTIGEILQDRASDKSRNAIEDLLNIKADVACLETGEVIDIKEIVAGQNIIVKVGERIPLDGYVVEGTTTVDMKALTGESIPVRVANNDEVLSGSINLSDVIRVCVTKTDSESTVTKILKLVEDASDRKSNTEKFITKFAKWYTPAVVVIAALIFVIPIIFFENAEVVDYLHRACVFLVISCPCSLVISIPLGYFGGMAVSSKNGILIKGGNYLEGLNKLSAVVFDKTGTLTKGNFKVLSINTTGKLSKEEIMEIAAHVEYFSTHPIAKSIVDEYGRIVNKNRVENVRDHPGLGLEANFDGEKVIIGNYNLMNLFGISYEIPKEIGTVVYMANEHELLGVIVIGDELRSETYWLIETLKKQGIKTIMMTGDNDITAQAVAKELALDVCYSKLLPHQKMSKLEEIIKNKPKKSEVAYVGDGINDTASIKRSDIGIALGGIASDASIEAADVVIMNDDLGKIDDAIKIAKYTRKIVIQNIVLSLAIKLIALIGGALGILGAFGMIIAVFADVGVCLLAILNTLRIIGKREF